MGSNTGVISMDALQEFASVDGQIYRLDKAQVSVLNGGLQYGYGLFETLRTYRGVFFAWDKHYKRLIDGCNALRIHIPFSEDAGLHYLNNLKDYYFDKGCIEDAVYRLTIAPKSIETWNINSSSTTIITRRKLPANIDSLQEQGVAVLILKSTRLPVITDNVRLKSINCTDIVLARLEMKSHGPKIYEGLFLLPNGNLIEATCSNIFIYIRQGNDMFIMTPPKADGPLLGITRQYIIDLAKQLNIKVIEASVNMDDLKNASEIFLTNAVQEIIPVNNIVLGNDIIFKAQNNQYPIAHSLLRLYKENTIGI
jgi:branched-subunit amino acid aminotransferase/4-amino-4-deoxychorismate lyase